MSTPLRRDRPLWEIWICQDTEQQRLVMVGKAHHCMVDGIAAVELGSMLLDVTPHPDADRFEQWSAARQPGPEQLLLRGVRDLIGRQIDLLRWPLKAVRTSPVSTVRQGAAHALRVGRALSNSFSAAPSSVLNGQLSPLRRLAWVERPLEDLRVIKRLHGTTINDVMLAAVAGGMRSYLLRRGQEPVSLKAMVPVNVRSDQDVLGNHISFVFARLPCQEPNAIGRLHQVHAVMRDRKRHGEPEGADLALKATEYTPGVVQNAISRIVASPRTFNLVVSNIPGPAQPMYMLGCRLEATYPVVPLADRHAVSVGMTTVRDRACFGIYTDRESMPDADALAVDIDQAISELLAVSPG